ncbi:dihydropteroate synthase [Buchananella felis]|uniref:dihydropteroate synthase n=1 Tax=Buchananella felis TaxID=3231492 RepID=UPI003527B278
MTDPLGLPTAALPEPAGAQAGPGPSGAAAAARRGASLAAELLGGAPGAAQLPLLMGVVNVTPDSFSDGGRFTSVAAAVAHSRALVDQGAQILDVGGYSTRPGAAPVAAAEEAERVVPVVAALARELPGVPVSVDTFRAEVAAAAVAAGAVMVNDVTGGADPRMHATVAALRLPTGAAPIYLCQHMRGTPQTMDSQATYTDVVADVRGELAAAVECYLAAGGQADRLVLDPGIGFAKDAAQSWTLLAHTPALLELGYPLLIGTSRKRLLAAALGEADQGPTGRDVATATTTALAALAGAWAVRVHNVAYSRDARAVAAAWVAAGGSVVQPHPPGG